jgi:hypothetical protein
MGICLFNDILKKTRSAGWRTVAAMKRIEKHSP